jgi:hypothetical protein
MYNERKVKSMDKEAIAQKRRNLVETWSMYRDKLLRR